jgi:hypothetical protein
MGLGGRIFSLFLFPVFSICRCAQLLDSFSGLAGSRMGSRPTSMTIPSAWARAGSGGLDAAGPAAAAASDGPGGAPAAFGASPRAGSRVPGAFSASGSSSSMTPLNAPAAAIPPMSRKSFASDTTAAPGNTATATSYSARDSLNPAPRESAQQPAPAASGHISAGERAAKLLPCCYLLLESMIEVLAADSGIQEDEMMVRVCCVCVCFRERE